MIDYRELFRPYTDPVEFDQIIEYNTVNEMWEHSLKKYADLIAISCNGLTHTFKSLESDAAKFRTTLKSLGLNRGDRVGLYAKNSYEFVYMYLGIVTSGYCGLIMPPHLDEKTVYGCTLKYSLKAICYGADLEEKINFTRGVNPSFPLISSNSLGTVDTPMVNDLNKKDPAVIMFTGGTTGKSKGALLSHGALMQGCVNGCYGTWNVFKQKYLLILPFSHVFGLVRNLMTSLYTGSNLFICLNNKDMFRDCAIFNPSIIVMVPAIAEMALNLSRQFKRNMLGASVKYIICGAANVPPYLIEEYHKLGVTLLAGYGLTETANLVSGNPKNLEKSDSVGYPYPHQEFKIVDGELWIKGPNLMDAYVGEDEENKKAFVDGWFKTGDLARFDDEGMLYIVGRSKEIIVLPTGENISPAEVETNFYNLKIVQDCQVFEDINENGKHILVLEVVPRMSELNNINTDDKMKYLMEELQKVNMTLLPFERMSKIVIRDKDFERTPSMKIVRYHKC